MKILSKIFNKQVWGVITIFFAFALVISIVGESYVKENEGNINYALGINPYEMVKGEQSGDTEYYKSDFYKEDGKTYDDVKMRENSMKVSEQAAADGAVLLKNENNALPLKEGDKLSFFGVSSKAANWLYSGFGSGNVGVSITDFKDLKGTFEAENKFTVNPTLSGVYENKQIWERISPASHYKEFLVNEKAWSAVNAAADYSFASYGDAAVYFITRNGGEDGDTWFDTSVRTSDEHVDDNYLELTKNECDTISALIKLKQQNVFKKVILVLNTGTPMAMKTINSYDLDAILWAGMGGNASFAAIYDVMSGKVNPSGKLVDTYAYDTDSAPSVVNTGDFEFTRYGSLPADNKAKNAYHHAYMVYQEGIYVGYRYYETRYEDTVMKSGNAAANVGVVNGKTEWRYSDEVLYPFGYGLSYTTFEYSSAKMKKVGENYEITVEVKNTGSVAGKTAVQAYIQKPYTEYDKANNIEKASVELAGYAKTGIIEPGKSESVTITVKGSELKTYDSYNAKTYILEKGDYYFAIGFDAHDALNNILSLKGYAAKDGMTDSYGKSTDGEKTLAFKHTSAKDDFKKYSVSSYTGKEVTNRFDDTDINLYAGTQDQKITYLSRNDWQTTYPKTNVKMIAMNKTFVADMQLATGIDKWEDESKVMPKYGEITSSNGQLSLIMLKGLPYDNPLWENLLDQLSWKETISLCGLGNHSISSVKSVNAPSVVAHDGPAGVKNSKTADVKTFMCFPCGVVLASTFDDALVEKVCDAFGMEMLHAGVGEIYGTGAGIHRSAYGGRNWEYFSEDGFLSGQILCAEVKGLQKRGAIVNIKHFALNDQEINRCGTTTWANEQSVREIYLKAFEAAVTEGKANGVMSALNRLGCTWVGRHKGILTDVLRTEWGFIGIVETDAAGGDYMRVGDARAEAIIAGNDLWLRGTKDDTEMWGNYTKNVTVATALRESAHRILYTVANSAAMNGVDDSTHFEYVTPWYYNTLYTVRTALWIVTAVCLLVTVCGFVLTFINKKNNIR